MEDEIVYPEVLDLGENSKVSREVEYIAPSYLAGDYVLWVIAKNSDNLPLGQMPAGEIHLNGDRRYLEIVQISDNSSFSSLILDSN